MTPELYEILFKIAGAFIMVLIGIIIWAAQRLVTNVGKLSENVASLNSTMTERNNSCRAKHAIIDHRLGCHSDDIRHQSTDIAVIKSKINL